MQDTFSVLECYTFSTSCGVLSCKSVKDLTADDATDKTPSIYLVGIRKGIQQSWSPFPVMDNGLYCFAFLQLFINPLAQRWNKYFQMEDAF